MAEVVYSIDHVVESLKQILTIHSRAILVAQPGAGKTTRVPIALLDETWLTGKKMVMLEPRRLSARAAARYMAERLGEKVGETVGYRVRNDTVVGRATRIEVVTEGVLTRMLLDDPTLADIGLVIFDEFHERNLHADTGLALCLQSQSLFETGMKILLMSATMDTKTLSTWLDAPVVESEGRLYPVETRYLEKPLVGKIEDAVVRVIRQVIAEETGDVLVFMPGVAEIRRVEAALREYRSESIIIHPLYGDLPFERQDEALLPDASGRRKVVLATPIAETGLTVEGVRIVIDSGFMRTPKFSPKTGMSHLVTEFVSKASADQRRGRAGRTSPGVCHRMWTEVEHERLAQHRTPEIVQSDLASLALVLAKWGATPDHLKWLTPPPSAHYDQATQLLEKLGIVQPSGAVTEHGRRIAEMGIHPRLAHMILKSAPIGLGGLACDLAALLGERDILKGEAAFQADIRYRADLLLHVDNTSVKRVKADADRLKRLFNISTNNASASDRAGIPLSFAYPDRIGQNRGGGKFVLSGGRGAYMRSDQPLMNEPFVAAAELDDAGSDSRIILAAPISIDELFQHHREAITESEEVYFDSSSQSIKAILTVRLGALKLKESPILHADKDKIVSALLDEVARTGLQILPWNRSGTQLRERIAAMRLIDSNWPDVSDEELLRTLHKWLSPYMVGIRQMNDLKRIPMSEVISSLLDWEQRRMLDQLAPTHLQVPSGNKIPIDYSDPEAPYMAVRLQEMFGMSETPRIAGGRLPVTIRLLSPAMRPVQITRDLASFWRDAYFEVKKDLKGRYPKHVWPDNPLDATATNRTKPKPK